MPRPSQELLGELRRKNKTLRDELGSAQKTAKEAQLRRTTGRDATKVSGQLLAVRSHHDTLRHRARQLTKDYKRMRDELQVLTREEAAQTRDNPQARRIRALENRLDKAMIKFNEAQSIRKTYDQIVRRLREERVGFDTQLSAIEKSLRAKRADLDELRTLAQEANHAKDVALAELDRTKAMALEEKEKRLKALRDKRGMAMARSKMNQTVRDREAKRASSVLALHGDMDEKEEAKLQASVEDQARERTSLQDQAAEARRRVERFEEAFQKIREATGVKDENEVIQKIVGQKEQHHSLQQLTRDNAQRIEELNREQAELKEHLDALKFSGGDGRGGNRQLIDSLDAQLKAALKALAGAKDRSDRITRTLVELRAGSAHLRDKVSGLRHEQQAMGMAPAESRRRAAPAAAKATRPGGDDDEDDDEAAAESKAGAADAAAEDAAAVDAAVLDLEHCEGVLVVALTYLKRFERTYARESAAEAASSGMSALDLPSAVARALSRVDGSAAPATRTAGVSLGSDVAAQLGLGESDVSVLREHNLRVGIRPAEPAKRPGMRIFGAPPEAAGQPAGAAPSARDDAALAAAASGRSRASARAAADAWEAETREAAAAAAAAEEEEDARHEEGGEEDDYADEFEADAVSHAQVKREAEQAVKAHSTRKHQRKGRSDTEPPRYLG